MNIRFHTIVLICLILLGGNSYAEFSDLHAPLDILLTVFSVTNTNDSGAGSLRQAILEANANPGLDSISFNISGVGPHTINVNSALPTIIQPLIIDGTSEPDFMSIPVIRIDGDLSGNVSGLNFSNTSDGSIVRGLMITRFSMYGIQIDPRADGITITGNWIGTTGNGSISVGNGNNGINVQGAHTIIGGIGEFDQNVITNNGNEGINLTGSGATGTQIRGNIIGLDPDGSTGSGNIDVGIALLSGSDSTIIGGPSVAERNIISMNVEGIEINSKNNVVQGNYVGTDVTGTFERGNRSDDGIEINFNATGNLIGGTEPEAMNVISANAQDGIQLNGPSNTILGNIIGLDASGTVDLGNGRYGVRIGGVSDNIIGGSTVSSRNVISGNNTLGMLLAGSSGTIIQGNYIGTDITGTIDIGNSSGLMLDSNASGNTIGGTLAGTGNLISGNNNFGVYLVTGCNNNILQGNIVGLSKLGTEALGNSGYGISVSSSNNTIGGTTSNARNVVSSNSGGIGLSGIGSTGNLVRGNYIGTDITGTVDLGNTNDGVLITSGATNNTIGGTDAGSGNLISGNNSDGIEINGATSNGNLVQGNYIGTDATGTQDLGNSVAGVRPSANNNTIGGTTAEARNVISGNSSGITIGSATGLVIEGNYIGTNASATAKIGNTFGLWITSGNNNTIGGSAAGAGNVISGNNQRGIYLIGASSFQYMIQGNFIGTNSSGQDLGNGGAGILIASSAFNNQLGGIQTGAGNTIAHNSGDGIWISDNAGSDNTILGNSIYSNSGIGIDLLNDQVTANDLGDDDSGPNDLQNYPLLEKATISDGNTTITGSLNSMADTTYRIEFFSSPTGDATGYGEGQTYLGFITGTTDGSGNASFDTTLTGVTITLGHAVTTTVTVDLGNGNFGSTSEFSANVTASPPPAEYDNPCNAAELPVDQSCSFEIFSNEDATDSGIPLTECEGYSGGDLWFKVEVPASGNVIAKIESDAQDHFPVNDGWAHRLGLAIYSGSCSTLTYDTCWIEPEGPGIPQNPEILLKAYSPGDTLFLRVWEHNNDDNGEFRICVFTDVTNPTIDCPLDVSSQVNPDSCSSLLVIPPPVTGDNYGIESVINDYNNTADASDLYSVGTTIITWTVTDLTGNTSNCIQNITIIDNEPPTLTCPGDLTAVCDISEQPAYSDYSVFSLAGGSATDNCDIDEASFTILNEISDGQSCPETISRTYQIADTNGNSVTCQQDIMINDTLDPVVDASPGNLTALCDISEQPAYSDLVAFVAAGGSVSDNCGIDTTSFLLQSEISSGTGNPKTITRTYLIADLCGNTAAYLQDIVFTDTQDPTIICSADIQQSADPGTCNATIVVPLPLADDNCEIDSVTNDFNGLADASGVYPLGTTSVTWTVTDLNGNTANCIQIITITDNEPPEIICPGTITEYLDENCQFILPDYTSSASINDNCDQAPSVTQSAALGTVLSGSGTIQEIVLTAHDVAGNESTCRFNITLMDNTPPEAFTINDTSVIVQEGVYKTSIEIPLPVFADNCGILSVTNDFNGGTDASGIYEYGSTTVTYTVSDINNNIATFNQLVVVGLENGPEHGLVIPEAFSPNEDGLNDRFKILGLEQYPENELKVYNVHGIEVFRMADYNNSWNGMASSGLGDHSKLPTGTYYYILNLNDGVGLLKGFIYLRRE